MIHSGTVTLSYLPVIAPGMNRKEFQPKVEQVISVEARGWPLKACRWFQRATVLLSSRGVLLASLRPATKRRGTR